MELSMADDDRVCPCGYDDSLDMATDDYFQNPYLVLDELRENCPIHWSRSLGGWFITRFDDVDWALKSPTIFSSRYHTARQVEALPTRLREKARPLIEMLDGHMVMMQDPPVHTVQRRILNKAFLPKHVSSLEAGVRSIIRELLDRHQSDRTMDFLVDFARPLPGFVLCNFLGVPRSDQEQFVKWGDAVTAFIINPNGLESVVDEALVAFDQMSTYIRALLEDSLANMSEAMNVIEILNQTDARGNKLSTDEIVATSIQLLFAGHLTSTIQLTIGLYTLMQHPEQTSILREDRSLVPGAIEEMFRFFGPVVVIPARTAVQEVVRYGQKILPGEAMFAGLGPAGRDPRHWERPDLFDVRRPASRHLEFGAGPHVCVGAPVTRFEAKIAFDELLTVMPNVELTNEPLWRNVYTIRYPESLEIAW